MIKKHIFFVDAETDGLYGPFLSVAAIVTDGSAIKDRFYAALEVKIDQIESSWVRENVFAHLKNAELYFKSENEMLEAFWDFWIKHRSTAEAIAYVPFPVESRLFERCVRLDVHNREFFGPFPLYDLASVIVSRGFDSDIDMPTFSGLNLPPHDAMNDVLMEAAVWKIIFKK